MVPERKTTQVKLKAIQTNEQKPEKHIRTHKFLTRKISQSKIHAPHQKIPDPPG